MCNRAFDVISIEISADSVVECNICTQSIDSKEKSACNLVPIEIRTEAKNSNKLCISYSTKVANVTKNSSVLLLIRILLCT